MNLPTVITDLVNAQNSFDSVSYANCFSETAIVFDENHNHKGKKEIEQWISQANEKYQAVMKPVSYEEKGSRSILKAESAGNFPGSPIVLQFHFEIRDGLISSLEITD